MLKRQRPSSPLPSADIPLVPIEPSLDVYERVVKRRRQFAPPRGSRHGGGVGGTSDDDEEDVPGSPEGRSEYTRGTTRWQEEAGLYKTANTLLHDLHAEQRHRAIFSSHSSYGVARHSHTPLDTCSQTVASYETRLSAHSFDRTASTSLHVQDIDRTTSLWNGRLVPEDVEVQNVTQRYEDTNRLLGSLFLTRKRQLDIRHDYTTT
ncbi:hypothetical protein B0H21DRAFT_538675 [Amylocystis lapponica]|nr:hypothetical protein B0H21DRAFT_199682 [Amylocystis lapponica]KAH9950520.1 hypothetical protein B0H21DRAFT_538675 [Amylocystis lapponica]